MAGNPHPRPSPKGRGDNRTPFVLSLSKGEWIALYAARVALRSTSPKPCAMQSWSR